MANNSTPLEAEPFSVLLSCWKGDDADALRHAVTSATIDQTRRPAELVLVQDGPVSADLAQTIMNLIDTIDVPIVHVPLDINLGLGPALQQGLSFCRYDIVARADADDYCLPTRFEKQIPLIEAGFDVVGSALAEFESDITKPERTRPVLTDHDDIVRQMRFKQAFHHPTVVFRKSTVQAVGGYDDMPSLEDYLLFAKLVMAGAQMTNIAEPLVLYRVGAGAYARRGGITMLAREAQLQKRFYDIGFIDRTQLARNIAARGAYRVIPEPARRAAYRMVWAK